jgi:acylphosphatase
MSEVEARRFVVRGRVQGVGFRWWTVREARQWGIVGTVRNRRDGAVEVEATGSREAMAGFSEALAQGPSSARVDEVEAEVATPTLSREFRVVR